MIIVEYHKVKTKLIKSKKTCKARENTREPNYDWFWLVEKKESLLWLVKACCESFLTKQTQSRHIHLKQSSLRVVWENGRETALLWCKSVHFFSYINNLFPVQCAVSSMMLLAEFHVSIIYSQLCFVNTSHLESWKRRWAYIITCFPDFNVTKVNKNNCCYYTYHNYEKRRSMVSP